MLIEWRAVVDNVHDVINNLHSAPSSLAVRNALGVAGRHLPQGELLRLIGESVLRIDSSVDSVLVKRKHEQRIQRALKDSCYSGQQFLDYARELLELAVAEESLTSPIGGEWLHQQGITEGRDIARWKQYFQGWWVNAPAGMTAEEFRALALDQITAARTERRRRPPESV